MDGYTFKVLQEVSMKYFNKLVLVPGDTGEYEDNRKYLNDNNMHNVYIMGLENFKLLQTEIILDIIKRYVVSDKEVNSTFYKTFEEVKEMSEEEIRMDQFLNYLTRYGLGLKGDDVYVPNDHSELNERYPIAIVETIELDRFIPQLTDLVNSGVALPTEDVDKIADILVSKISKLKNDAMLTFIENVINKEVKITLYEKLNLYPFDIDELFRLIFIKGELGSMVIKNYLINKINLTSNELDNIFAKYISLYKEEGMFELAGGFNRNKKLFMGLKHIGSKTFKTMVNRISKLSKKYHKPKETNEYLLLTNKNYDIDKFSRIVNKLDTPYLIKLYKAFQYRSISKLNRLSSVPMKFRIRNGKEYVNDINLPFNLDWYTQRSILLHSIISDRVKDNLSKLNTNININGVKLAVPTSVKNFIGNIPVGSVVESDSESIIVGIYWENVGHESVDLDLSSRSTTSIIGWNGDFNANDQVYSGDVTDGGNDGGTECIAINNPDGIYSIAVTLYDGPDVEFKFFIAKSSKVPNPNDLKSIDTKNIIFSTTLKITKENPELRVGFIVNNEFVFDNTISNNRIPQVSPENILFATKRSVASNIFLNEIIEPNINNGQEVTINNLVKLIE